MTKLTGPCRVCGKTHTETLIDFGLQPIVHHLLKHKDQEFPAFPFILEGCENCGFMQLKEVIAPQILYENYFTVSAWKYQPHMDHLAELIIEKTQLPLNSRILEIGCNDGTFLEVLQKSGFKNLLGIEPTADASLLALGKGFQVVKDFVNPQSGRALVKENGKFDIIIARQVLEHISNLQEFQSTLRILLRPGGFVVIEVPDMWLNLTEPDYTLWEEHVNYFTIESLENYLNKCGIQLVHSETIMFSGRCLTVIGQFTGQPRRFSSQGINSLLSAIDKFKNNWIPFSGSVRKHLMEIKANGHKIAVYGAGARSCTFVNFNGLGEFIECFVDDQNEKQGLWVPGCRLPIKSSATLYSDKISLCLLGVNTENEENVMGKHKTWAKDDKYFRSILPPSKMLLETWTPFA
ncbi:MAG: class I SAM-dependent methyltransferase [Desulfomonilaceae bacterium]